MSDDNEKLGKIQAGVETVRELAEKSIKDFGEVTAETNSKIEKISEDTSKKLAEMQGEKLALQNELKETNAKVDKVVKEYDDFVKQANRLNIGASGLDAYGEAQSKWSSEFSKYLRKGVAPSGDAIKEIAEEFVKKATDHDCERTKSVAMNQMIDEQDDNTKGFYSISECKSFVTGSNPDGGYLVAPDYRQDLAITRKFETSPMRAISRIITTGTNEVEVPILDKTGVSGGWVGEIASRTVTDTPQIGLLKIPVHEQYASPKMSQKMLDDAFINIEQYLLDTTDDILTRTENTAFVSGSGSAEPKGILSYDAWTTNTTPTVAGVYETGAIEQINSGTSAVITADGLIRLQNALTEAYQPNAVFLAKRSSFGMISLLKDGVGDYLLNKNILSDGVEMRVLGKPLLFADDMPIVGADALSVAYGDFKVGYTIVDRLGIRVLRDPYTSKPFIIFYTTKRVGGAVTSYEAIKLQKLAA